MKPIQLTPNSGTALAGRWCRKLEDGCPFKILYVGETLIVSHDEDGEEQVSFLSDNGDDFSELEPDELKELGIETIKGHGIESIQVDDPLGGAFDSLVAEKRKQVKDIIDDGKLEGLPNYGEGFFGTMFVKEPDKDPVGHEREEILQMLKTVMELKENFILTANREDYIREKAVYDTMKSVFDWIKLRGKTETK